MEAKRAVIRIQLDNDAKQMLDNICENRGMTQIAVLSRLVGWLTRQSNLVQTAILSGLDETDQSQLAKLVLNRMVVAEPDGNSDGDASKRAGAKRK